MGLLDYLGGNGGLLPFDQQWMLANGAQSQPGTGGYSAFPGYLPITQGALGYNGRVLPQDDPQGASASAPGGVPMPQPRPEGLGTGGILPGGPQPPPQMPLWMQAGAQGTPPGIQPAQPPQAQQGGLGGLAGMLGGLFGVGNAQAQSAPGGTPASPGIGDRLSAGLMGFANAGGGALPALSNLISGLATGQRSDPRGQALQIMQQQQAATYQALRQSGVPHGEAVAAALNPEVLKTIAPNLYQKPTLQETGTDPFSGQKSFSVYDPNKLTLSPVGAGGVGGQAQPNTTDTMFNNIEAGKAVGAPMEQLLQNVPNSLRDGVRAMIGGKAIPSNLSMRGQARDMAIKLAHAIDPNFDEMTIPMRQTFAHGMAQTTPASYGGQKLLLNTALQHYAELSDALVDLHNTNGVLTGLPGSGAAANLYNRAANSSSAMGGTVNKLNDISQKASGEVGKLYSGSQGGGEREREATAGRFSPGNTPNQSIGGLEAARNLILDKLNSLQNQRDQAYGASGENVYPLLDRETKSALEKIDANIAKLRGGQGPATGATAAPPPGKYHYDPATGRMIAQ